MHGDNKAWAPGLCGEQVRLSERVSLLPVAAPCSFYGLSDAPGSHVWLQPTSGGVGSVGTVLQEVFHNLGLYGHGWRNGVEYRDTTTAM